LDGKQTIWYSNNIQSFIVNGYEGDDHFHFDDITTQLGATINGGLDNDK
jgi:hypothetical protein